MLQFKIDTGADVLVISVQHGLLQSKRWSIKCSQRLTGASQQQLNVYGWFKANLRRNNTKVSQVVNVVSRLQKPAIELTCFRSLGITIPGRTSFGKKWCCDVNKNFTVSLEAESPLHHQDKARSHTIYSQRTKKNCTTTPSESQARTRATKAGAFGSIISKIKEPTEWCSGIMVVPKPNGRT